MMDLEGINIFYDRTIEEWSEKYKGIPLCSFSIVDVLNGSAKLNKDMCYWCIDGRLYETLEPNKKVPAKRPPKRPPKKHDSNDVVNKTDTFEEIRQAELANAINILHDNGCIAVTIDEYQTLTNQTNTELSAKEPRLYILYEGEFGGYIARVCNDSPSAKSLVKVQSQLAEDGYWVSKVCSSSTDNEVFMICYKEGD